MHMLLLVLVLLVLVLLVLVLLLLQQQQQLLLLLQDTGEVAKEFSVLSVSDLITKDIDDLRLQAQQQRDKMQEQIRGED
jgi:predicted membrane metal-binding protein